MPRYEKSSLKGEAGKEFGDLYAKIKIIIPKNISKKEIELFKQLSEIRNKSYVDAN